MENHAQKIIIAAGTGFIGQSLINYFRDYEIVVLTRNFSRKDAKTPRMGNEERRTENGLHTPTTSNFKPQTSNSFPSNVRYVYWDAKTLGNWWNELEGAKAVINLAGKSVNCRYNEKNKAEIFSSRLDSTRIIGEAINQCIHPPEVWINAGSATIYRHSTDKQMTESNGEFHSDFSVQVCKAWEKTFEECTTPITRKVFLRISIVLGKEGGVFPTLRSLAKIGLGGRHGNGQQFVSWIHEKDLCRSIEFIMEHQELEGVFNCAAPNPVRNHEFMCLLRKNLGVPFGLPQPEWMLNIGTWFMRTQKELVMKSRNVVPEKLLQHGFTFCYETVDQALKDLSTKK